MIYLTLTTDKPHPRAGEPFNLWVTLDTAATEPLRVTFEKHRVYVDASGERALCVIEPDYFSEDGYPKPIDLMAGDTKGMTTVMVKAMAKNPQCPPPAGPDPQPVNILFPDWLMLTAFVSSKGSVLVGKEHIVLTIKPY